MKIKIELNRATAGSVYSEPDMEAVEQLLPSDEELAERESAKAEKERKEKAEEAKKKAQKAQEKAEKGPEDLPGDAPDDEDGGGDEEDSESDEDEEEGGDEEDGDEEESDDSDDSDSDEDEEDEEATAKSFGDADVIGTDSLEAQNLKADTEARAKLNPDDMTAEELEAYLAEEKEAAEQKAVEEAKPQTDADGNPIAKPEKPQTETATNEVEVKTKNGTVEKPKDRPEMPKAVASALEAMATGIQPTSFL